MSEEETNKPEEVEKQAPAAEESAPAPAAEAAPAEKPAAAEAAETPAAAPAAKDAPAAKEGAPAAAKEGAPAAKEGAPAAPGKDEEKKDIFAEIMGEDPAAKTKVYKAKGSKNISKGVIYVTSTFNNTMVTITDERGSTLAWSSAGKMGFKGSRKSTAYAAQIVSQDACRQAMGHGLREAEIRVKGPGAGRESAVRAVQSIGIDISAIRDVTPIPHNGCRPKKARRV
jgi:small subunit ribosomal protein S11